MNGTEANIIMIVHYGIIAISVLLFLIFILAIYAVRHPSQSAIDQRNTPLDDDYTNPAYEYHHRHHICSPSNVLWGIGQD